MLNTLAMIVMYFTGISGLVFLYRCPIRTAFPELKKDITKTMRMGFFLLTLSLYFWLVNDFLFKEHEAKILGQTFGISLGTLAVLQVLHLKKQLQLCTDHPKAILLLFLLFLASQWTHLVRVHMSSGIELPVILGVSSWLGVQFRKSFQGRVFWLLVLMICLVYAVVVMGYYNSPMWIIGALVAFKVVFLAVYLSDRDTRIEMLRPASLWLTFIILLNL